MKNMKWNIIVLFIFCFAVKITFGQTVKGLYVNKFNQILGVAAKEDSLLQYAKGNGFTYLALYSLGSINLQDAAKAQALGAFINKARTSYGVQQVGAVGETAAFFETMIVPFNNTRTAATQKFNVFNLEFEFWIPSSVQPGGVYCDSYLRPNNCACDTAGGFRYYRKIYDRINQLAEQQGALTETYVGWPNAGQSKYIATVSDRIFIHAYRSDMNSTYGYSKNRWEYFASANKKVTLLPIFSAEPEFMGPLLASNSETEPFNVFQNNFQNETASWKQNVTMPGYVWFTYTMMPKTNLATASDPLGVEEDLSAIAQAIQNSLKMYPNPTNGILNVDCDPTKLEKVKLRVVNINGQLVKNKTFYRQKDGGKMNQTVDLSDLANGMYIVQLGTDEKILTNEKIILSK